MLTPRFGNWIVNFFAPRSRYPKKVARKRPHPPGGRFRVKFYPRSGKIADERR